MPASISDAFTVQFSREVARTLDYEDGRGKLVFVFEFGSSGPFTLHRQPLCNRKCVQFTAENQAWLALACDRSKAYLRSCGYEVEVFPPITAGRLMAALQQTEAGDRLFFVVESFFASLCR